MLPDAFVEVVMAPPYYGNCWPRHCANSWKGFWSCIGGLVGIVFRSVCWLEDGSKRICYRQICTPISALMKNRRHRMP